MHQVGQKVARYGKAGVGRAVINEQNTKATLIQPIFRVLGWDVEDLEDVHLEYKQKSKDKPVDYALMLQRNPCLFVEAKALGESLDDRKWANQIMGYASVAGVQWVVLTDGDEYRVYNSHATVPVEEKLFRKIRVSDESTQPAETLALLSKDKMHDRQINRMWEAHFVDRQVQAALQQMFAADRGPDIALVRILSKRLARLTPAEIKAGLRRLQVQVNCSTTLEPARKRLTTKKVDKRKTVRKSIDKQILGVSLVDLLQAGVIEAPLKVFRRYKGVDLIATIEKDGAVTSQGVSHTSCSAAAAFARGTVVGGAPSTNGWSFWQFKSANGQVATLDQPRQEFLRRQKS